jgi:hypothetical protein
VRFLLVLNTPGFLRYYDETIDGLLERGHDVLLGFTDPTLRAEALDALDQRPRRPDMLGGMPARTDRYARLTVRIRTLADFVRYLDPRFARAQWLRDRRRVKVLESPLLERAVRDRDSLPAPVVRVLVAGLLAAEHAIPSAPEIERLLRELAVDALLVSPLVTGGSPQTDYVKSARALGIRSGVLVASWDNLTNKGLMRVVPDRVYVWNAAQRREAVELHGVNPEQVVVTGAQPFDRWFGRAPTASREAFCARVGLNPKRPFVTFVGSTSNIADGGTEDRFVRRWVEALRASERDLAEVGILVRPHPDRRGPWSTIDLSGLENAVVWPPARPNSVVQAARGEYFDSLHHSAAIVGINTSAMVEGAIIDRPVLTVRLPEFDQSQDGTLHFDHLLPENGGPLVVAQSLAQHASQLRALIADPAPATEQNRRFVERFIRPNGLERPATPQLVDAIAALPTASGERVPRWHACVRPLVLLAAAGERRREGRQQSARAKREALRVRTLRSEDALLRAAERVRSVPSASAALRGAAVLSRSYGHFRDAALKKRVAREKRRRAKSQATRQHALKRRPRV